MMKFHTRDTAYDFCRRHGFLSKETTPSRYCSLLMKENYGTEFEKVQLVLETAWINDGKPYYNVYPTISKMLSNTSLELDCSHINLPLPAILLRFTEGNHLRSVLAGEFPKVKIRYRDNQEGDRGLGVWCDFGETRRNKIPVPIYSYQTMVLRNGLTVEESLSRYVESQELQDPSKVLQAVKIVCGLCLIARDPELVMPDVLARDKGKPLSETLIGRAHRRGKRGWLVGAELQVSPHYRRPHFAIRWTGKGRKTPKLVPVKGAIIHKRSVENVPTGHLNKFISH